MKMLEKMGWQKGLGIGKDLQGRSTPIEASVRKGKGAIGLYGSENNDKYEKNIEGEETLKKSKQRGQWKKDELKKKQPKYLIKTAEEILLENDESTDYKSLSKNTLFTQTTSKIKIIDMTGREQKVLYDYASLSRRHNRPDDHDEKPSKNTFELPELVHNLDLLVNMTEEDIIKNDRQLKYHEDMIVSMRNEEKRTSEKIEQEKRQIDSIQKIIELIDKCEKMTIDTSKANISDLIDMFKYLKNNFYQEYKVYNLSELCLPLLVPIFSRLYTNWNPFNDEDNKVLYLENYREWKTILEDANSSSHRHQMDTFHRLLWESWMPSVRFAIQRHNIRECLSIIDFIDAWSSIVPYWMIENILEQFILPKLTSEVENWNPLTDTVPVHAWIHPWLPLMKEKLDILFPTIRQKLGNALLNWYPSDESAKAILTPWRNVFSTGSWDAFMVKHIVPKLAQLLRDFNINPRSQNIDTWNYVQAWEDLIPSASYISLIDEIFFPKWLFVLSSWLNTKPNYDEVSRWYLGWKSQFPEKLLNHPNIKAKLTQGLIMMNQSVSGLSVTYNPQTPATRALPTTPSQSLPTSVQMTSTPSITSFKDIIEKKAAEHNILFLPITNRFQEGKQVYRLGNVNVYIDRNVIFTLKNGIWMPTSLNELIQNAI